MEKCDGMPAKQKLLRKERKILKYEAMHKDKILLVILGSIGFILFWKGMVDFLKNVDFFNNPAVTITIGLVIMILSGWAIKR